MKIYLCSRVGKDARPLNDVVAKSLTESGFTVYVPHEQKPNNPTDGRYDKEQIWDLDFAAMQRSEICVVVGRIGKDCSFEIGWFYNDKRPIFFVPAGDTTYLDSPMLIPALTSNKHVENPSAAGPEVLRTMLKTGKLGIK